MWGKRYITFCLQRQDSNCQDCITISMERAKSRRLSSIIKSVAAESGVGHLIGIAERGSGLGMGSQIQQLTDRVNSLGLSHLITRKKGMSMSDEIAMLTAIINEHLIDNQQSAMHSNESQLQSINESDTEGDPEGDPEWDTHDIVSVDRQNVDSKSEMIITDPPLPFSGSIIDEESEIHSVQKVDRVASPGRLADKNCGHLKGTL